jgi:hypothetical protein
MGFVCLRAILYKSNVLLRRPFSWFSDYVFPVFLGALALYFKKFPFNYVTLLIYSAASGWWSTLVTTLKLRSCPSC